MIVYSSLLQGSDEWKTRRAGRITASRCKDARDVLKSGNPSQKQMAYACQVAVERIAGRPIDQPFESWQMKEGTLQEPFARMAYEERTGYLVEEVGAYATDDDAFLYSPDGAIDDDGLLEIKTIISAERIIAVVANADYSDFMDQCLFGLWLTARAWIDLAVWAPALEPIGAALTIHRIHRDEAAIEALEADLMAFRGLVSGYESKLRKLTK